MNHRLHLVHQQYKDFIICIFDMFFRGANLLKTPYIIVVFLYI